MEDNNIKEKKHFFHKKEKQAELATVPKKKKKVWLIVLIIVAIVVVLIGSAVKNMTSQIETAVNTVEIEPVEKRDLSDSVSLKGEQDERDVSCSRRDHCGGCAGR